MGRFETDVLVREANVKALADLSGWWIDVVHARRQTAVVVRWPETCSAVSLPTSLICDGKHRRYADRKL
jgi:hypothetical protein